MDSSVECQKVTTELSKMSYEVDRLVQIETEYKHLQATSPQSAPANEEIIAELTRQNNKSEADLDVKMQKLAEEQEEVIRLHGVNNQLQQERVEQEKTNSSLSDDVSDLLQEVNIVKKELKQAVADKLDLLEQHREEKKSLRRSRTDCGPSTDSVSF